MTLRHWLLIPRSISGRCVASLVLFTGAGLVLPSPLTQGVSRLHAQAAGEIAYTEAGCARCHSIAARGIEATVSERMQGGDLGDVGGEHDAAWVIAFVKQEVELDGRPHRAPYRGPDGQLQSLAEWLVALGQE